MSCSDRIPGNLVSSWLTRVKALSLCRYGALLNSTEMPCKRSGKRGKWLINEPLSVTYVCLENPRVGGSIPSPATI